MNLAFTRSSAGDLLDLSRRVSRDSDRRPFRDQPQRDGLTQGAGHAGDDSYFACKHHGGLSCDRHSNRRLVTFP
jgi:hypothetical protein